MLEHPDGPRALSQDLAHAVGIEPHDDAQQNHLCLVSRQAREMGQRGVKGEPRLEAPIDLGGEQPSSTSGATGSVRRRLARRPASITRRRQIVNVHRRNAVAISREPAQSRRDLEPDVRRDVLGPAAGNGDLQIAKQARMDVPPESSHGPLLAQTSRGQDAAEGGFGQIAHVVPHTPIGAWNSERESTGRQSLHQP